MSNQCLICFENCKYPAILDLNCECQYVVHYKCYNKWWKMKKTCMICHTLANKPRSYYHFKDKTNYFYLLDLNSKRPKSELTVNNLIPNLKHHIIIFSFIILFDLFFLKFNFGFMLCFFVFYFFLIIP